jgi:hypothetical protein
VKLSLPFALAIAALLVVAIVNLWIFGRFTVDDAFITWRYGRNLIEHGIWGYNPTGFDLTQAYTNPLYAALSILPAATGWDMVLTFKLLSLVVMAGLAAAFLHTVEDKPRMVLVLAMIVAIPASVAHAVSGLETVLYGGVLALFFIETERGRWGAALAAVIVLVLTRPEAWLLFALYPGALVTAHIWPGTLPQRPSRALVLAQIVTLGVVALAYFGFHLWHFGEVLPNTYFIKSGDGITPAQALAILPYVVPALAVLAFGNRRTGLLLLLYFGIVGYRYAASDLLMNYMQRFPFQIVLPMALYLGRAVSRRRDSGVPGIAVWGIALYLGAFAVQTRGLGDHLGIANYYPRLLDSHVLLGRTLNGLAREGRISGFALGDAGAPAYHADIRALDTIGLASRMVAREGLTPEVVAAYAPDVVAFFATEEGIRDLPDRHAALWAYVAETGMQERCEIYWARQYTLRLYTRVDYPALTEACATSRAANGANELAYALAHLARPPWAYWHE